MKNITYAINKSTGDIISRLGSRVAWPILDYATIGADGNYNKPFEYYIEMMNVYDVPSFEWNKLNWTKKIPIDIKNLHRKFWGLKPLRG